MAEEQACPICGAAVRLNARYPHYVCAECARRASSRDGRALRFGNIGLSGGYIAHYRDTDEEYPSQTCYIDGVECRADEARFGGIVIQAEDKQ